MAKIFDNRYEWERTVGEGGFGKVFLVIDKLDGSRKALKQMELFNKDVETPIEMNKKANKITQEAAILTVFKHENIIKFYSSFRVEDYFYIVTEFCEKGSLNDFIEKQKEKGINFTNESLLLKWLRESANALRYLHEEHQKIHRDIKPLNIFLTKEDHVKLGDFGLTLTTNDKKSIILSKDAGTFDYYSPETIDDIKYSFKTDIWSLGVSFYELSIYELPFKRPSEILNNKEANDLPSKNFTRNYNSIIKKMMNKNPNERIDANNLIKYLNDNFNHEVEINKLSSGINQMDFIENHSTKIKRNRVKTATIKINNARSLCCMALFNKGTNILATDFIKNELHILDLNFKKIRSVRLNDSLNFPLGICVQVKENGEEYIFLTDNTADKVFLLNSSFQLIKTIGNNLNSIHYISVDSNNLYVSSGDDTVYIFNSNDEQLKSKLKIKRPLNSTSDINYVYIVSGFVGERDVDNRKLNALKYGNCINIISKFNFNIIKKIQFDNWFCPLSIYLSNDENIYTIAHELDNNKIWSKNRYLFQINKENNQIINKIELNDIEFFYDSIYLNNKIILCGVNDKFNEMRIIEFY